MAWGSRAIRRVDFVGIAYGADGWVRPNRFRRARTTAGSAGVEKSSTGENPLSTVIQSATEISAAVSTRLGQALSAHCPLQLQVQRLLKGNKYGIGQGNPSGPRDPTRSSRRCRWKLIKAKIPGIHLQPARKNAQKKTMTAKSKVCRSW